MRFLLPNIGPLIIFERIHQNQVIQLQKVYRTLLYWYQLRNLAQNCAKISNLKSPASILLSELNIFAILLRFDGKFLDFLQKIWSQNFRHFHTVTVSHCGKDGNLLSRFFGKNFVKTTVSLMKLLNSWFDEGIRKIQRPLE